MKNREKGVLIVTVTVLLLTSFVITGCGSDDPKSLAKQTYDIGRQSLGVLFNPSKTAGLMKKAAAIEKKAAKLSEEDKAVYAEELARLGGGALGWLFDAASGDALQQVNDAAQDALQQMNAAAQDALNQTDAAAQDALQQTNDAADAAKQAVDALKSLGF